MKRKMLVAGIVLMFVVMCGSMVVMASGAASGDLASAFKNTYNAGKAQIGTIINDIIVPVVKIVLVVALIVSVVRIAIMYNRQQQLSWAAFIVIAVALVFVMIAPPYLLALAGV